MTKNKLIVVTGASGTIGTEVSQSLIDDGYHILAIGRNKPKLTKDFYWVYCDITDEPMLEYIIQNRISAFAPFYSIINMAGIQGEVGQFVNNDWKEWNRCIQTNFISIAHLIKLFIPNIMNGGRIINFAGGGSTSVRQNLTSYSCSKTALIRLTETLAMELSDRQITANCVSPGAFYSKMTEDVINSGIEKCGESEYNSAVNLRNNRDDNLTKMIKVNELVQYLLSEKSNDITGKTISAVWDNFTSLDLSGKDNYTLRRFVP